MLIKGGDFAMGSDDPEAYPEDGEAPSRPVHVDDFDLDITAVTVAAFAQFVEATAYRTEAESLGWSFVFGGLLPDDHEPSRGVEASPWWRQVFAADWAHPEGPLSDVIDRGNHPVLHVSWNDANAFCEWSNRRLPLEAEWEYGARGGIASARFPWGDELEPEGRHMMNVWQGSFPDGNDVSDGYFGTAPVRSFPPNGFGLYEMTGNTWEWCADRFSEGEDRVIKGGSYLCHASYCHRYRVAARSSNPPDTATGHLSFRTAK